ncbi:MAG: hypothetical protein U0401_17925 [Anaerolineae bacterium]
MATKIKTLTFYFCRIALLLAFLLSLFFSPGKVQAASCVKPKPDFSGVWLNQDPGGAPQLAKFRFNCGPPRTGFYLQFCSDTGCGSEMQVDDTVYMNTKRVNYIDRYFKMKIELKLVPSTGVLRLKFAVTNRSTGRTNTFVEEYTYLALNPGA